MNDDSEYQLGYNAAMQHMSDEMAKYRTAIESLLLHVSGQLQASIRSLLNEAMHRDRPQ